MLVVGRGVALDVLLGCRGPRHARKRVHRLALRDDLRGRVGGRPPHDPGLAGCEHVDGVVEQHGHLVGRAEQGVGQLGQGRGLPLRCHRPLGPPGARVHDEGDDDGDQDEHDERDGVLGLRDREGADGVGEEPVEQQRARHGADERRSDAAEEGDEHGDQQVERHGERQAGVLGEQDEQTGDRGRRDEGDDVPQANSPAGQCSPRHAPASTGSEGVGHDVHVDVTGVGDDLLGGARHRERAPPRAPGAADDDLRGVHAAGHVEDRLGRVLPRDRVPRAAQLVGEAPQRCQGGQGWPAQAVGPRDVQGEQLPARAARGDSGAAPQQRLTLGATGERDDDPLPRRPGRVDAVVGAVPLQALVDAVREPEQGQLAQGGEVADPEVVRQRGVDLLGLVDVAVRHPTAQRLG